MDINIAIGVASKTAKELLLQSLKTGDVIKVKAEILPIIYHYGIVVKNENNFVVYHNDPFTFNRKGGNIIKENAEDWIKNKEIVCVINTNLTEIDIELKVKNSIKDKYHFFNNNCEHFIDGIRNNIVYSPQVVGWTIAIASIALAYSILKKRRK